VLMPRPDTQQPVGADGGTATEATTGAPTSMASDAPSTPEPSITETDAPVPDPSATPTPPPPLSIVTPTPAPITDDPQVEETRAADAVEQVVVSTNELAQRGDGGTIGIDLIATGFVQGELEAMAQDQADLGYTQVGDATITEITPLSVDLAASPPTISLSVCVDTSDVDVLDAAGTSLKDSLYDPGHPVKHVYGAQFIDDLWKIATHDIPDEQDCPAA